MMNLKSIRCILIGCLIGSCKSKLPNVVQQEQVFQEKTNTPKIIFLHFKMNLKECVLIEQKSVDGTLKQNESEQPESTNYIQLNVFNKQQLVQRIFIKHPLYPSVEFSNDQNELETKALSLDEAEFFVRFSNSIFPLEVQVLESLNKRPLHLLTTFQVY